MSESKKLFKNTIALTIGNFASKMLTFFMLPLYTAVLTTSEYGVADLVFTTTSLLYPLLTCLAMEFVMRFALDENYNKKVVFSSALFIDLFGFVVLALFTPLAAKLLTLENVWFLFLVYYLTSTLSTITAQFAKGIEKVKLYSISGVINTTVVIGCNLLFLLVFKMGVKGYLLAYILGAFTSMLFLWITCRLYGFIQFIYINDLVYIKIFLRYSIPMIPNSISWWVNNSLDKYILTFFWGTSVTGIYAAGYRIPSFLTIISSIFLSAWQISAVKDFGSEESKKFYSNIYRKYSSLNMVLGFIIIAFTKPIARILLSNEFFEAWKFAPILVFAYLFQTMSGFIGSVYTSSKKTTMLFVSTALGATVNVMLNYLLIPIYSATGAAIATALSYIVVWIIRLLHSRLKILKFDINIFKEIICYILCMIVCIFVILDYNIFVIVTAGICLILLNYRDISSIVLSIYNIITSILHRNMT